MHHVNQPMSPPYQSNANRNPFPSTSGVPGGMAGAAGNGMGRVGRGAPVLLRMSPAGVPTYYYYTPQLQQQSVTSTPSDARSSGAQTPPPMLSPMASDPNSPNHNHHRQLPVTPPSPFHFQQQHYSPPPVAEQSPLAIPSHAPPALVPQSHCFFSPPASPSPPRTPPPSNPMVHPQKVVQSPYPPSPLANQRQVTAPQNPHRYQSRAHLASGTSAVAIDNKIEQAMDLVKSHLMFAVREEVEVLKEKIAELMERINQLEVENSILKAHASTETLAQLGGGGAGVGGQPVVTPGASVQMQAQGQQQAS